jgi:LysM repeat protein
MRGRLVLFLSVSLNVTLAAGVYSLWRMGDPARLQKTGNTNTVLVGATNKYIPIYRKQFFSWREVEAPDYAIYIANLRDIGCPEATIRDIIVADVNQLYARKRAFEALNPDQFETLEEERRALLTRLLGPDWDTTVQAEPAFANVVFDGPVLGSLSDVTKQAVQDILIRWDEAASRKHSDKEEAALEQQMRNELVALLSPLQLEEFLSRYSPNAGNLRKELENLKYFNVAPDEFRNLFRATDTIDLQIRSLGDSDDPAVQQQLQSLKNQRETALKNALGPKRYAEFVKLQDPAYRDAVTAARTAGGNPQTILQLYQINQAAAAEQARIQDDPNLNEIQKAIELKKIELEQLKAQAQAKGELPPEPPPPPTPPVQLANQRHVIEPNESLATLSLRYVIKISDIIAANPGVNFNTLKPGDAINLPVILPTPPPPSQ